MISNAPRWLAPTSLDDALRLRSEYGEEATVVAGGTYLGILINQGFLAPDAFLSLRKVPELGSIDVADRASSAAGVLHLGAMVTHRAVERSPAVCEGWPALAYTFSLVASPRVRNQATVGGVLADADYASDPPAMLMALGAEVVLRSTVGERVVPVEEFITGYYETDLRSDELLVQVRVRADTERAVYRKFRSRSSEDRPCVAVAAVRAGEETRVVVGAVSERPQYLPEACALLRGRMERDRETREEVGRRYAETIEPIADSRGTSAYRRRIVAVEVRRALEDLAND